MENGINSDEAPRKYLRYGVISIIALLALIGIGAVLYFKSISYVATVGGEKVTKAEYTFFLNFSKDQILKKFGYTKGSESSSEETFWNTKYGNETVLDYTRKEALGYVKSLKVEYIKAKEKKITLNEEDLENIEQLLKEDARKYEKTGNNGAGGIIYGVTVDQLREIYKQISYAKKLEKYVIRELKFDEADVKKYYDNNPDRFIETEFRKNEEAVWVRHVLIKTFEGDDTTKRLPEDKIKVARRKAEGILKQLEKGEDFVVLAKNYSEDPASAIAGGDYIFVKGQMDKNFEDTAFNKLKPGEISGIVETGLGFHIIKLEEKIPEGKPVSYRAAREYREFNLGIQTLIDSHYQSLLEEWKRAYEIKINKSIYESIK